jgi:hypothetical protein
MGQGMGRERKIDRHAPRVTTFEPADGSMRGRPRVRKRAGVWCRSCTWGRRASLILGGPGSKLAFVIEFKAKLPLTLAVMLVWCNSGWGRDTDGKNYLLPRQNRAGQREFR